MSRVGKKPIPVPKEVKINLNGTHLTVEGPRGKMEHKIPESILLDIQPDVIQVKRKDENAPVNGMYGLTRALVANMVTGVSTGFTKTLEINGVGYRANMKGKDLEILVGYSHPVLYKAPEGISFKLDNPNRIVVEGYDRQAVGQVAAEIRSIRKPEPYKGKGIKYADEIIRKKAGKAAI